MENIRIIFVLAAKYSDEYEASEVMLQAFDACRQNLSTNVEWVKELDFQSLELNKTDFVVFEEFEGQVFEALKSSKCAILGPWAVSVCLMDGKSIPNYPWPIHNVAMYNCIVTSSYLPRNVKMGIKEKVELMGGCYVDTLVAKNTHLVTGSAISEKYLAAAEAGVKLMCPSWVEDVWKESQNINIHADDAQFDKHKCLCFQNLTVCSTGLSNVAERKKIEKLIKDNGGIFTGKLNLANTNVLVCSGQGGLNSDKYKAARQKPNIKCVNIDWILDSVQKGYALPHDEYQVQKITSTPTKEPVNPEFSILSAIGGPNLSQRTWVEDTVSSPFSPKKAKDNYRDLVENLDIKKAKRAGQYLDGCSVYVTGFGPDHTEKLNKILNLSGATRYDSFSDRVTHVIVGDHTFHEAKLIKSKGTSCLLVSIRWLIDSIAQEHPVNEEKYLIDASEMEISQLGSPLSKKGLNLLRSNRTVTEQEIGADTNNSGTVEKMEEDECIVQHYLGQANTEDTLARLLDGATTNLSKRVQDPPKSALQFRPADYSTQQTTMSGSQDETANDRIFEKKKFILVGFNDEEYKELKEKIEEFSGEVVPKSFKGIPDYAVVPIFNKIEVHHTVTEIVNDLFISECLREETLLTDIAYYHRPFSVPDTNPLENCVIAISSYGGMERVFLTSLIEALGGVSQEQFARVRNEAKKVVASTHLVSSEATGKKYEAGLKWGLPVVSKDWLFSCASTGRRAYEGDFLIGDSKAPEKMVESNCEVGNPSISALRNATPESSPGPSTRNSRVLTPVNRVTPVHKRLHDSDEKSFSERTPLNEIMKKYRETIKYNFAEPTGTPDLKRGYDSAEKPFSQVTPSSKIMKNFRESKMNVAEPSGSEDNSQYSLPPLWADIKTPDTPLGRCLTPNPSASLKKQLVLWLQQFPDKPPPKSNASTPISELKKRIWNNALKRSAEYLNFDEPGTQQSSQENGDMEARGSAAEVSDSEVSHRSFDVTPENINFVSKLQQLEEMLTASGGGRRHSRNFQSTIPVSAGTSEFKDSQPCTVGWDFKDEMNSTSIDTRGRIFAISGVADENVRMQMVQQLENLGAMYSSLKNFDPKCTHLLCPKPARNEKSLSSMAAGKWILHTSYLEKSVEAGHLLNEEDFEFGNPQSLGRFLVPTDAETERKMQRMHWWRKEIAKRGYGAFNDMRAIVVANKREPIVRVIEAGGGVVIDVKPPFDDTVHATHCLLEQKSIENITDYIPLARQGVYLVNTIFINDFLYEPNRDIRDCILPYFSKYYART